jgi:hypothetical protein
MSDESSSHVTNAGASLPREQEQGQLQARAKKARTVQRERKRRWLLITDLLEQRALQLLEDPKSDNLALARIVALVKDARVFKQRESALRFTRRAAWAQKHGTIPDSVPAPGRSISQDTLDEIEAKLSLM